MLCLRRRLTRIVWVRTWINGGAYRAPPVSPTLRTICVPCARQLAARLLA